MSGVPNQAAAVPTLCCRPDERVRTQTTANSFAEINGNEPLAPPQRREGNKHALGGQQLQLHVSRPRA
jgi:hypothetical protein